MRHKGVSFNQLDDRNMSRIRYLKVSEETGEEVPSEQLVKGVEISKGRYVIVDRTARLVRAAGHQDQYSDIDDPWFMHRVGEIPDAFNRS